MQIAHTSAQAMASSAGAMGKVSAAMDPVKVAQTAQEFAKQHAKMDMASDVMDDAIDGMFEDEGEADDLVNQVQTSPACACDALRQACVRLSTKATDPHMAVHQIALLCAVTNLIITSSAGA
jgi:predicted extracellular nuclease